jgi:uncharacterized protein (UPF0332 family)
MVIKDMIDCEHSRMLKRAPPDHEIIETEVAASIYDLDSARRDFSFNDYKWATIKSYYSMLHIANAVARSRGLIIENHYCVYLYLSKLADQKILESNYSVGFKSIYDSRLRADYGLTYDKNTAVDAIELADRFRTRMKDLIL